MNSEAFSAEEGWMESLAFLADLTLLVWRNMPDAEPSVAILYKPNLLATDEVISNAIVV